MKKEKNNYKMLLQRLAKVAVFAIALFSVISIFPTTVNAAGFKYSEFDWDTFYEENKTYWEEVCSSEDEGKMKEKCEKKLLKSQKKFYVRLYKLLAKYQAAGLFINDNIIIETVFFGLIASDFTDTSADYKVDWDTYQNSFNYDESADDDSFQVKVDYSGGKEAQEYFAKETDTLRTLIRNMIAYNTTCYGTYGDAVEVETEDGGTRLTCPNGGVLTDLDYYSKIQCADRLASYEKGFWEYYLSKYAYDKMLGFFQKFHFLKLFFDDDDHNSCMNFQGSYKEMYYDYEDIETVSTNKYFDFLKYNRYYDNKYHLQKHFKETVLDPAEAKCMTEDICGEESIEAMDLYEQYDEEILEVRTNLNLDIIDILKEYGIEVYWGQEEEYNYEEGAAEAVRNSFFWPIGSTETEVRDGVTYADGTPAPTTITSYYGVRTHPVTKEPNSMHYGVDIAGPYGTNIVAVADGEVVKVLTGCTDKSSACGSSYGNHIIIAHPNGDYTLYAHLQSVDSAIKVGVGVKKGQLLGKMGSTGRSTGSHLHFEVRVGGNSQKFAVDPLTYVSAESPRPAASEGDFSVRETSLTKDEFVSALTSYCTKYPNKCTDNFRKVFLMNAANIYDWAIEAGINPEVVIVRHLLEGEAHKDKNNYWGLSCYNGQESSTCNKFATFEDGVKAFAKNLTSHNYQNASDMMAKYAYLGKYWYNPGGWGLGGCKYFEYISKYMSQSRISVATRACSSSAPSCTLSGESGCTPTTAEDQQAYTMYQVERMSTVRYNIFGL